MAYRAHSREELNEYMKTFDDLTLAEKQDLRAWVADGNSIYDNPFSLYDEDCHPMDYVNAVRFNTEMFEGYINGTNLFRFESEAGPDIEPGIPF